MYNHKKKKIGNVIHSTIINNNLINLDNDNINNNININKIKDNNNIIRPCTGGIFVPKPSKKNDGFRFKNDKHKKGKINYITFF